MDSDALAIVQEMELNTSGDIIPEDISEQAPNKQQDISIAKKPKAHKCLFLSIGIIINSIVSGIIVFSVMKYGGILSYNVPSCFWTEWTSWTQCKSSLIVGKQTRVQIYTGYLKSESLCDLKERFESKSCYDFSNIFFNRKLDITFDPSTLYSTCFLSDDNTTISNRKTDRTPYNPKAESRFQNYRGALVNTCVENSTSMYYEIYFQYTINTTLSQRKLILELGIAERNKIDNHHYVGLGSGWSFHLANCLTINKVCLYYHQPNRQFTKKEFSDNTAGTKINGTFRILIDRERNTFFLFYNDTVFLTFHDVLSYSSLCPVFGVYSPNLAEVYLQIVSVGNMTSAF